MAEASTIIDRTLAPLRRALFGSPGPGDNVQLTSDALDKVREKINDCLEHRGGEVSARVRAAELGHLYLTLDTAGRERFLRLLAEEYGLDRDALDQAMAAVQAAADRDGRRQAEQVLRQALIPRRVSLLTQFNAVPQGVKFLVDMRADLLPVARRHPDLRSLDDDFRRLLASWFDIGFLELRTIDWDAPAALLEKLIAYESVHEIRSWDDLKNRLGPDRRCFAFFHPRMPDEPLIFVEVALVKGIASNVQTLLDEHAPETDVDAADSAIFYSISNCQAGLAGVSFGNFLIKRVVDELRRDLPNLKTFATLSPIPGFRHWLEGRIGQQGEVALWSAAEARTLAGLANEAEPEVALRQLLARPGWWEDAQFADGLRPILQRACATYLLEARRGTQVDDRVEHFHLSNGARLERINWLADVSPNGMRQSAGLMVNYLYRLAEIDKNHEAYRGSGKVVASTTVRRLAKA